MKEIATLKDEIPVSVYGGKAYWLKWLYDQGLDVPESIFIPVMNRSEQIELNSNQMIKSALRKKIKNIFENSLLVVRSSALDEDDFAESKAGNYQSILNVHDFDGVMRAIELMRGSLNDDNYLGIIVQKMIEAKYSGVIFSSDPKDGNRLKLHIAAVQGTGDKLMSGLNRGNEVCVEIKNGEIALSDDKDSFIEHTYLTQLVALAKVVERKLNYPVDIEWCVDQKSKKLILLQCRPMTGVFPKKNKIVQIAEENTRDIPRYLTLNNKIWLRELAEKYHFQISKAYLMVSSCRKETLPYMKIQTNTPDKFGGYSVVLTSPLRIHGEVQRFFVGNKKKVYSVTRCHRFGVRQVASYEQIQSCLADLYQAAREQQWACSAIIQEIWDAKYTGIIKRFAGGYIIEIARGHFLSKGIIPMSVYVTDAIGKIIYRREIRQDRYVDIVEGCILEYRLRSAEEIVVTDKCIINLIETVKKLLEEQNLLVEFGLLNDNSLSPYVIDCTPVEKSASELSEKNISKGVVSEGRIEGMLIKLSLEEKLDSFNKHFYNEITDISTDQRKKNYIFCVKIPDIRLIEVLNKYDNRHIGFVFAEGSMLCHLAVLLRERGIPAIRGVNVQLLEEGSEYCLDTTKPEIRKL